MPRYQNSSRSPIIVMGTSVIMFLLCFSREYTLNTLKPLNLDALCATGSWHRNKLGHVIQIYLCISSKGKVQQHI